MTKIYKYNLNFSNGKYKLVWPKGSIPLSVGMQGDEFFLWGSVNPDEKETETRTFLMVGTGYEVETNTIKKHWATLQQRYSVWHIFELRKP